eukprot:TRINITY_DN5665_c0_g1_i1.p1 TRINITY_DN5665_c0_g1~~TRINITY_DN5665_c0_g1_i1.p1  ORF type:complete len:1094 (+),score=429.98 TRINITY_DN5665_c0_g1_i1:90-3371(+)
MAPPDSRPEPGVLVRAAVSIPAGPGAALQVFLAKCPEGTNVHQHIATIAHERLLDTLATADASVGFADDLEYLNFVELALVARLHAYACKLGSLANVFLQEILAAKTPTAEITAALNDLYDVFAALTAEKLFKTERVPLALQLCSELSLSPVETRGFIFLLICHGGVEFLTKDVRPTAALMAKFSGMSSHEFVHFLGEERVHFKQGLLGSTDAQRTKRVFTQSAMKMPEEVVAVLYRVKLTETGFLKLDKTSLAELVQKEGLVEGGGVFATAGAGEDGEDEGMEEEEEEDEEADDAEDAAAPARKKRKVQHIDPEAAPAEAAAASTAPTPVTEASPPPSGSPIPTAKLPEGAKQEDGVLPVWVPTRPPQEPTAPVTVADAGPYKDDLDYLDDVFKLLATQIRIRTTESDMKDEDPDAMQFTAPKSKQESQLRELKGRERMLKLRIERRMVKTRASPDHALPMMEALQQKRKFTNFEKMVLLLLVGNIMSHDILIAANGKYVMRGDAQRECTVGFVLYVLCESLEERVVRRKVFYKSANLLKDGLLTVTSKTYGASDLMECTVDIDRRMVDSLMGLSTEFSEIVDGSHLYSSKIPMDHVVLPSEHKDKILSTITNYDAFQRCKKRVGLDDIVSYGTGLVLLFYGPSGTGKTMLANAIARSMGRKVLLVSFQSQRARPDPGSLRFVFREAKLNDAIVFFDECDSFFESRENNPVLPSVLQELEKYNGIMILATNKAHSLDEAMNRRITLAIEFHPPDHQMRCQIWKQHMPPSLRVSDNVDWAALATDYELTGGLIKNAILTSIAQAVARENGSDNPSLRMEDLVTGAKTQLRSFFNKDLNAPNQVIPKRSFRDCIFDTNTRRKLEDVVKRYKGSKHCQTLWSFGQSEVADYNTITVLYGPSGVGKSLAAEAISYECGCVARVFNMMRAPEDYEQIFEQAAQAGAIVVFDEAQHLLDHSDRSRQLLGLMQYHAKKATRPVIFIVRTDDGERSIDPHSAGLTGPHVTIRIAPPSKAQRMQHWKRAFPKDTPVDESIDFEAIAQRDMSPGAIRNAVYFAACEASMQPPTERVVTSAILDDAIQEVKRLSRPRAESLYV